MLHITKKGQCWLTEQKWNISQICKYNCWPVTKIKYKKEGFRNKGSNLTEFANFYKFYLYLHIDDIKIKIFNMYKLYLLWSTIKCLWLRWERSTASQLPQPNYPQRTIIGFKYIIYIILFKQKSKYDYV